MGAIEDSLRMNFGAKLRLFEVLAVIFVIGVGLLAWRYLSEKEPSQLPEDKDIVEIRVKMNSDGVATTSFEEFCIPTPAIPRIMAYLRPSTPEPKPALWVSGGSMIATTSNGHRYQIGYFYTDGNVDAFCVQMDPPDRKTTYYRGGNARELYKAIEEARKSKTL